MQNNFRPAFALSPYFVNCSLSRYLEPDEELLWEAHHANHSRAFKIILLIEAGITAAILLFVGDPNKVPFLIFWLIVAVLNTLLVYKLCYLIPTHYILTQRRFLILYFPQCSSSNNPDKRKVLNIDFAQVQKITCSDSLISFTSITENIPFVSPSRNVKWLYEELLAHWEEAQQTQTPQEKARLEHLFRPPLNRFIMYLFVRSFLFIFFVVLFLLPYILKLPEWVRIWSFVSIFIVQFVMGGSTSAGKNYLLSLFVGKEYKAARTFAPEYNRLDFRSTVVMAFVLLLLCGLYYLVK